MNIDAALSTFIQEAHDLLAQMEEQLLAIEEGTGDEETLRALFRAAHTIKGSAGLFGLGSIVGITHVAENLLDFVRNGELQISPEMIVILLKTRDHIQELVILLEEGKEESQELSERGMELLIALNQFNPGFSKTQKSESSLNNKNEDKKTNTIESVSNSEKNLSKNNNWHFSLRFASDIFQNGMDPIAFVRYLERHGEVKALSILDSQIISGDSFDPELCYLGMEIELASHAERKILEDTFDFIREDSLVEILEPHADMESYKRLFMLLPEPENEIRKIWLENNTVNEKEWNYICGAVEIQEESIAITVEDSAVSDRKSLEALHSISKIPDTNSPEKRRDATKFIKVDAGKLDQLINLVGEMVIACAGTQLLAQRTDNSELIESSSVIADLVSQVRDGALNLRMTPVGEIFSRFSRVVRDVSKELNKEIELNISGAETEIDRSMAEKLVDPLMHIVRNAMDHGVEPIDERIAAGKSSRATIRLNAYQEAGSVVIEVADDGGGLKREKIIAKAIEKNLISSAENLSDRDVFHLIFAPGFSTADSVTNLSGRGVGMDVVKKNIESLRGSVDIDSQRSVGTIIRLRLPLTLAIIDGFQVGVLEHSFVLPLGMVIECLELPEEARQEGGCCINLRGEPLPIIRLREIFELHGNYPERENIVVVQFGTTKAGFIVDKLLGELQAVIKPLGKIFSGLKGISGSTILGDGSVSLVLDVAQLIAKLQKIERDKEAVKL